MLLLLLFWDEFHYLITKFQHLEIFHTKKIPQKFPSKGIHPETLGSGCVTISPYLGLVSICGCCTMRVGQRKLRPEVSVASEEYKKQFQTSKANMGRGRMERDISGNFSASEYCNWRKKERVHHGRNIGETTFGCLKQKT